MLIYSFSQSKNAIKPQSIILIAKKRKFSAKFVAIWRFVVLTFRFFPFGGRKSYKTKLYILKRHFNSSSPKQCFILLLFGALLLWISLWRFLPFECEMWNGTNQTPCISYPFNGYVKVVLVSLFIKFPTNTRVSVKCWSYITVGITSNKISYQYLD